MPRPALARRLPVGAEPLPGGGAHFRVWAPGRRRVEVETRAPGDAAEGVRTPLEPEADGYWAAAVAGAGTGTLYGFRLDREEAWPDPASRYQPDGPDGPSQVVDPERFGWSDAAWSGVSLEGPGGPVLYEIHVGTFTPEGTWTAAAAKLPRLRDLGITVVQVMPVADFPGRFGWGYDGVFLFAPYRRYGRPDDFRHFVDAAHAAGLGVVLDVVYNHIGPRGSCLLRYSPAYRSGTHGTEWGDAFDFDGPGSGPVRAFFLANVRHWIEEYHLDGFRFDATQDLEDRSEVHILAAMGREARAAAGDRRLLLVAENEPQDTKLVRPPEEGGYGLDVIGNEDFHHSVVVAATGRREGYYSNHRGTPQELLSALKHGFLYQGQWYGWQDQRRGTSTRGVRPRALAHFLENHDQVANGPGGARLHALVSPGTWRALTTLQLLGPQTPFLFQGQEFGSSAPFFYFADHEPELARAVREGREEFLSQFRDLATPEGRAALPDPCDVATFARSKLDWGEWDTHGESVALHRDLLRLRREDPTLSGLHPSTLDGAVLDAEAFAVRWIGGERDASGDRLLLVNLGRELELAPAPEPLLAPPGKARWRVAWSSEDPRYGGPGTPPVESGAWILPATSAVLLLPGEDRERESRRVGGADGENPRPVPSAPGTRDGRR